jgi:hypothetical protein
MKRYAIVYNIIIDPISHNNTPFTRMWANNSKSRTDASRKKMSVDEWNLAHLGLVTVF